MGDTKILDSAMMNKHASNFTDLFGMWICLSVNDAEHCCCSISDSKFELQFRGSSFEFEWIRIEYCSVGDMNIWDSARMNQHASNFTDLFGVWICLV